MQSRGKSPSHSRTIEVYNRDGVNFVAFIGNGEEVLSGDRKGMLRRWRANDGRQVGEPVRVGKRIYAAALSPDCTWLVCGLDAMARVWDMTTHKKALDVHDGHTAIVSSVDVSPDSTRFATAGLDFCAFIWSMKTGERLVGPLLHEYCVLVVRFCPDSAHARIATADFFSIHIYNSDNGQQLLAISYTFRQSISSPLTWSADGRQLLAMSSKEAACFEVSEGKLLNTWPIPGHPDESQIANFFTSITLSRNQRFIVVLVGRTLSFWDTSTYQQAVRVTQTPSHLWSLSLSPSDDRIVVGGRNGNIVWRSLGDFLPDKYIRMNPAPITSSSLPAPRSNHDAFPSRLEMAVDNIIRNVTKTSPLVLIDVISGRLCDAQERLTIFRSEPRFSELVSSMALEQDDTRIVRVVAQYFRYVMLSHVWDGKEPSYQDVKLVGSVWNLEPSPLHKKLQKFCEVVREGGCRWAWSDTCCIDKTISTVLNQSLKMMYKWYEASAATLALLANVNSPSAPGGLKYSIWMTRAWTAQELLAPKVIRFYDRNWKPYLDDTRLNHKESPMIMQELAEAIGISREIIKSFNPDDLSVREKLRLASTRNALIEEDIAYALIGILKSDIRPEYGEGYAALGHLLEEIVARLGDVTVLAWAGKPSPYNSCLPACLSVYSHTPRSSPVIEGTEMNRRVEALRSSLSQTDAVSIHDHITRLLPANFANRRLHLPSIIFPVKRISLQGFGSGQEMHYRARVSGIGHLEFYTSDRLPVVEPRRLIFVHPWIDDLLDPQDGFSWQSASEAESDSDSEAESDGGSARASPLRTVPPTITMDDYTRALRLIVRLQQPFHALLLLQQPDGKFKRVATEHEIPVTGLDPRINFVNDIRTEVVQIL